MSRNYSFYLIVFVSAWILIVAGLVLGYFYATSTVELKKFEYLPKNIQSLYIKREDADRMSKYLDLQKSEIIPSNKPVSSDVGELQTQVKTLREKNQALYQDNVNLNDKNWLLVNDLKSRKTIYDKKSKEYEKIKELSSQVAKLKKENIEKSKKYEQNIQNLKGDLESLNIKLQKKELNSQNFSAKATKEEIKNNPTLTEKNSFLMGQTKQIRARLNEAYNKNAKLLEEKNSEITKLKNQLSKQELNINSLLSKHTSKLIDLEQKNSMLLRDLKQQIASLQVQNKKDLAEKNQEISRLKKTYDEKISLLKTKQLTFEEQNVKQNSQNANGEVIILQQKNEQLLREKEAMELKLEDMENKIRSITFQKEKDYDDMLKKVKNSLANSNEDVERRTNRLESRILEAASIIDNLKAQNANLIKQLGKFDTKKLIPMSKFEKIEKKHARNYKIFNEVVNSLEKEKKSILQKSKNQMKEYENSTNKKMKSLSEKYLKANTLIDSLNAKNKLLVSENKTIKMISKEKSEQLLEKYNLTSHELNTTGNKLEEMSKKFMALQEQNDKLALKNSVLQKSLKKTENEYKSSDTKLTEEIKNQKAHMEELEKIVQTSKEKIATLTNQNEKIAHENSNLNKSLESKSLDFKTKTEEFLKEIKTQRDRASNLEKDLQSSKEEVIKLTALNDKMLKDNHENTNTLQKQYKKSQSSLLLANSELKKVKKRLKNIEQNSTKTDKMVEKMLNDRKNKIDILTARVKNVGETLQFTQDKLVSVKDEKDSLKKDITILNEEIQTLKRSKENSEKVHNEKIAQLIEEKKGLNQNVKEKDIKISDFQDEIKTIRLKNSALTNRLKDTIATKEKDKNVTQGLVLKYNTALNDLRNRKAEIMALKNSMNELKIEASKKTAPSINDVDSKKLSMLENRVKTLQNENLALGEKLKSNKTKENKPQKLSKPKFLESIKCDDMKVGSNEATAGCVERVKEFLAKYSPRNFYEVTPIVDNGGFASLKKVANSKLKIPKSEISRLTRLSNIGLGKDRSKSGGAIIKGVFGDFARISYSNSNEDIPKKRGFIIRVYE